MADKKLVTYDCTLTFSFQTKDDDFMNSRFNFDHIGLVLDVLNGGSISLFGNSRSNHPFIFSDINDVLFTCCPEKSAYLSSKDLFNSILCHQGFESLGDCVFNYQPIKGSQFFLGVKEKESCYEKKETESPQKSEKLPRRSRYKKP